MPSLPRLLVLLLFPLLALRPLLAHAHPISADGDVAAEVASPGAPEASDPDRQGIRWGGYPIFNYSTDRGLMVGALGQRFNYARKPFESVTTLQLSTATQGPDVAYLSYERTGLGPFRLVSDFEGVRSDEEPFYGIGDDTPGTLRRTSLRVLLAGATLRREIGQAGLEVEGGASASSENVAVDGSSAYAALELGVVRERRDSEFIPTRGSYASLRGLVSPDALSTRAAWSRVDADYRQYVPIIDEQRLSLAGQTRYTWASTEAPVTSKAKLGSWTTLRGLPLNRYLSNHSFSLRGEARSIWLQTRVFGYPLKGGNGVFVDAGKVGDDFSRLVSHRWHMAWGGSLFGSYFTDDFVGSADFGFAEGYSAVYLRLGHSF